MIRRIIFSIAAVATLFFVGTTSSSAQTAGTSTLEQIGFIMNKSYAFGMNGAGSILSLRDMSSGTEVMTVSAEGTNDIVVGAVIGDMSSMSASGRDQLRNDIFFMNTRLPVGTIIVEPSGIVRMEHRLNTAMVPMSQISVVISRFSNEVSRRRAELFA